MLKFFIMNEKKWVSSWNASVRPTKQRNFRRNAPLHTLRKFVHSHLSKELRKKYKRRSLSLRVGDTVKIMVGNFKGKQAKVSEVNTKMSKVYIEGMERVKKDGSKARVPFNASNLMVTVLGKEDLRVKSAASKQHSEPKVRKTLETEKEFQTQPKQEKKHDKQKK